MNIPKDDIAVREARIQNANTPSVNALKPSAATTEVQPVNPHQGAQPPRTAIRQRTKKDRRQGERRKRQEQVLLDTRSHRERRKKTRRSTDLEARQETEKPSVNLRGIDVYT
ncbi:MAG: hypothetical protein AMJ53_09335 [Gammaproteobacteria bacterium SG8_11]|nr:MAG: hypothetical protein AMJ53_09335 [Gammaproteobacteria bacterium SG8_11]